MDVLPPCTWLRATISKAEVLARHLPFAPSPRFLPVHPTTLLSFYSYNRVIICVFLIFHLNITTWVIIFKDNNFASTSLWFFLYSCVHEKTTELENYWRTDWVHGARDIEMKGWQVHSSGSWLCSMHVSHARQNDIEQHTYFMSVSWCWCSMCHMM